MKNDPDDLFAWTNHEKSPAEKLANLRAEVQRHMDLYYGDATPEISDAAFDELYRTLESLENQHPELADPSSPTQRPGRPSAITAFIQRPHREPMLSIDDVFERKQDAPNVPISRELRHIELIEFFTRLQKLTSSHAPLVTVEPKIDGVAVSLVYERGELAYALTRGDGLHGDDITHNVLTIREIPRRLPISRDETPDLIEIRGEIFMPNAAFLTMNEERDALGLAVFANPRNATAGTLKQLDATIAAERPLQFLAHSLGAHEGIDFPDEFAFHAFLERVKLPANHPLQLAKNLEELLDFVEKIDSSRHAIAYATDGAVVKLLDREQREQLGKTARAPRWACAYKFLPEQKETRVLGITIQVGRTGVLTPVAELEPVLLSGTIVSRATLHNQDEISRKDIRIGDLVVVEKAGEIIPSIVSVVHAARPADTQAYSIEHAVGGICPSCQTQITRENVAWRCPSLSCPAQTATSLAHFSSRKALDIEALGKTVADALVREFSLHSPHELFELEEEKLANLNLGTSDQPRRFGEKNAAKLLSALHLAREKPLHLWIFALGIPQIGESAAKEIAHFHPDFSALLTSDILTDIVERATLDATRKEKNAARKQSDHDEQKKSLAAEVDLLKVRINELDAKLSALNISGELGPVAAQNWLHFQDSDYGKSIIEAILRFNPKSSHYQADSNSPALFRGKTFVITGTLSQERRYFQELIEANGGKVSSSLSSKSSFLLAGENAGSKLEKAKKEQVAILNEQEFLALISHEPQG